MMGTIRITGLCLALCTLLSVQAYSRAGYDTRPSVQFELLQKALEKYKGIQENGGWPKIKSPKKFYMKGQTDPAISQIKKRLRITGEFTEADSSGLFTDELVAAVQKIQKRLGYKENGVVDAQLVKQLNIPVEERIRQIEVNIDRWQATPAHQSGTRLVANIPEFRLYVYEGEKAVFDMAIVVGSLNNKTVLFSDEMTHVVFSPYWNVPPSIVRSEILPAMRRNRNYLRNNGYEQTGTENGLPVIRQKPGAHNSLGKVKFVFPNEHNIYLHDTPAKSLFDFPKRTFSHGCIRLAEPAKLARYLLRNDPDWTEEKIEAAMDAGREQYVKLDVPVAVSLVYYTAWVADDGTVHFREDVYGLDKNNSYKVAMK